MACKMDNHRRSAKESGHGGGMATVMSGMDGLGGTGMAIGGMDSMEAMSSSMAGIGPMRAMGAKSIIRDMEITLSVRLTLFAANR